MTTIGVLGLILGIAVLIVMSMKGIHPIVFSLFASIIVIVTNQLDFWKAISSSYSTGFANFIGSYFLLFMLGSVYGVIMRESGAARSIADKLIHVFGAKYALLATIIVTIIMSYGGISVFIIIFALYPIVAPLFKEANISKELMPATIVLASVVILLAVPGTPTLTNATLCSVLGGTIYDAPVLGLICAVVMFVLGYLYLVWQQKKMAARGEGFVDSEGVVDAIVENEVKNLPSFLLSILPLFAVIATVFLTKNILTSINTINLSLFIAIALAIILYWKSIFADIKKLTVEGINSSLSPLISTAAILGFAAVVQTAPAFNVFMNSAMGLANVFNPYVAGALAINVGSGITGAALSGMQIFTNTMMPAFINLEFNHAAFHRIMVIAAGVLDSLPHSSTQILLATVIGVNLWREYKHMFMISVVLPAIGVVVGILCALAGIV